jgi:hypothetical protein
VSHMRAWAGAASAHASDWTFGRMPRSRVESGGECVSAKVGAEWLPAARQSADRRSRSRRAAEGGEGQMPASVLVAHRQLKPDPGLPLDQHLRPGTSGRPRPKGTRLETRTSIRWPLVEVDLVGCSALQGGMRASFVVPGDEPGELLSKGLDAQRHHREPSRAFDLHRLDESLGNSNRAVVAEGPEARPNRLLLTPLLETQTGKPRPRICRSLPHRATSRLYRVAVSP